MKYEFRLAGHTFTLKKVQICDFMSEETTCFQANLYCDGKLLAQVHNEGHGGATFYYLTADDIDWARQIEAEVRKEVWLVCLTGDIIYHDLGTVADEALYSPFECQERDR